MTTVPTVNMPAFHSNPEFKCGMCKWFHVGFDGKTCQKTRKAMSDTRACIEYQAYRNSPFEPLLKDKFLREMESSLKVFAKEHLESLQAELATYRLFKKPDITYRDLATEDNLLMLAHSFEQCQAFTDRVVEIKHSLEEKRSELQGFTSDAQSYIFSHYSEQVRGLKNDTERGMFFRYAMPSLFRANEKLDTVISRAESTMNNLKQTHFSLCQMQDGAKEIYKSRIQSIVSGTRSKGI